MTNIIRITLFSLLSISFHIVQSKEIDRAIYSTAFKPSISSYLQNKGSKNKLLQNALKRPTYATDSSHNNYFTSQQGGGGLNIHEENSSSVGSGLSITNSNGNSNTYNQPSNSYNQPSNSYNQPSDSYNQPSNSQGSSFVPTYTSPAATSSSSTGSTAPISYDYYDGPSQSDNSQSQPSSFQNQPNNFQAQPSSFQQQTSNFHNQPSNFYGSSFVPTYTSSQAGSPPLNAPVSSSTGSLPFNQQPSGGHNQPYTNHNQPTFGNAEPSFDSSNVVYSLTPPADYSSNSIYLAENSPASSSIGSSSSYSSNSGSGFYAPSSTTSSLGVQYGQQNGDHIYSTASSQSSSTSDGGYFSSSSGSGSQGTTSQGTLYNQQGGSSSSYQDSMLLGQPAPSSGTGPYYATSGDGTTSQASLYNPLGTGVYEDNMYYAQPGGQDASGSNDYYAGSGGTPSHGNLYNQQGTVPYSDDMYLGGPDASNPIESEFPESSFIDPLPPPVVSPIEELPEDLLIGESSNEETYAEYVPPMTEDQNLGDTGDEEPAEEGEAAEETAPAEEEPEAAAPTPAPAPPPAVPAAAAAADNNPLTFLNLVGSDFQPGRLVNIFFGLFIMLFMIIIHGYTLWILGIAYLPGTRSLNEWEFDRDKVGDILRVVINSIEYWENRI